MPRFEYKGRDRQGHAVQGELEAESELVAAEALMRRDIMPTALRQRSRHTLTINWAQLDFSTIALDELVMFTRQMYALMKAGIPIVRAIQGLALSAHTPMLRTTLTELAQDLSAGRSLSSAMREHPKVFNALFIALINVGENMGGLESVFLQLSNHFDLELETRKRLKSAVRYPLFVVIAIVVAMFILNVKVIPVFAGIFSKSGVELPLATRILLATSGFFVRWWWLLLLLMGGAVGGWLAWLRTAKGRLFWGQKQLKLPVMGNIIEQTLLARFGRTFAMMLKAGVPLHQSLNLVADAVDNDYVAGKIRDMRFGVERGDTLSRTAAASGLFTPLVMQMFAVGEETGQIEELMLEAAEYYEREVDYALKSVAARIEPILLVLVAIMVLIMALGIFTPMWDMLRAVRGH